MFVILCTFSLFLIPFLTFVRSFGTATKSLTYLQFKHILLIRKIILFRSILKDNLHMLSNR